MVKRIKQAVSVLVAIVFVITLTPGVYATETDSSYITKGTYQYSSNENFNRQLPDRFEFRDDCFMRSSHLGCCHLAELSAAGDDYLGQSVSQLWKKP